GDDDHGTVAAGVGQEAASCRPGRQRFAAGDGGVFEERGKLQALQLAVGADALALRLQPEAAIGLFVAGNADVAVGRSHGGILLGTVRRLLVGGRKARRSGESPYAKGTPVRWAMSRKLATTAGAN